MFKQLFCNHNYSRIDLLSESKQVGNDNYVVDVDVYKCSKCHKLMSFSKTIKIENDYYHRNKTNV